MRESPILARHSGLFIFLQLSSDSNLSYNTIFVGYIAIFQQSDFLCKFYERRVFIPKNKFYVY